MNGRRILVVLLLAAAAILALFLVYFPRLEGKPALSGYVEGEPLYPAAALPGRLIEIRVQRGDVVSAGELLFTIDPARGEAQLNQALAELAAATALAADTRRGLRASELAAIEAQLAASQARLTEAQQTLGRTQPLAEAGAASMAQLDTATAAREAAAAQVESIRRQLQTARLGARQDQIKAADERVHQAQAAVKAARATLDDQTQLAPVSGRIEEVFFQKGEWTPANQPVLSLIPDGRVRLRFFVPQGEVASYAVGRELAFGCDGCPEGLTARITYVSPRPEFTPPVIYSRDTRDRMVFLVEALPEGEARLAPGQPIDVKPLPAASAPAGKQP